MWGVGENNSWESSHGNRRWRCVFRSGEILARFLPRTVGRAPFRGPANNDSRIRLFVFLRKKNSRIYRFSYEFVVYHEQIVSASSVMGFVLTVAGLSVPANAPNATGNGSSGDSMLAYQANFHQAFLQSAMAQNIQIQQQILAQNQALHQLLQQQQMLPPVSLGLTRSDLKNFLSRWKKCFLHLQCSNISIFANFYDFCIIVVEVIKWVSF